MVKGTPKIRMGKQSLDLDLGVKEQWQRAQSEILPAY